MITFTGLIQDSSNSMVEYNGSKCTLNIYLVSASKFTEVQAVVQISSITSSDEKESLNAITNLITYSYPVETGTAFEVIQDLVLTDLGKSYPDNKFSIV